MNLIKHTKLLSYLLPLIAVGCIKPPIPHSSQSSIIDQCIQYVTSSRKPVQNESVELPLFDNLDANCRSEIFARLPFSQLITIFKPSDPALKKAVKDRVEGYWPQWFLNEISLENPHNFSEQLVLHYLAFLKIPYLLNSDKRDLVMNPNLMVSLWDHQMFMNPVGDHTVAYLNKMDQSLYIYDTQSKKVLGSKKIPNNGSYFDPLFPGFFQGTIEKLSSNSFVLRLMTNKATRQLPNDTDDITLWEWDTTGKLENTNRFEIELRKSTYDFARRLSVLRISDSSFVSLSFDNPKLEVTLWNSERKKHLEKHLVNNSIPGTSRTKSAVMTLLADLKKIGIEVNSDAPFLPPYGIGRPLDKKVKIVMSEKSVYFASNDEDPFNQMDALTLSKAPNFNVILSTKNGDIFYRESDKVLYVNIWEMVKKVVSLNANQSKCLPARTIN